LKNRNGYPINSGIFTKFVTLVIKEKTRNTTRIPFKSIFSEVYRVYPFNEIWTNMKSKMDGRVNLMKMLLLQLYNDIKFTWHDL